MDSQKLLQACQDGKVEEVKKLLQSAKDLNLNRKDDNGMTPLAYAADKGHMEVVQELILRGAAIQEVLERGYAQDYPEIISLLQENHFEKDDQARQSQENFFNHTANIQFQDGLSQQQMFATNGLSNEYLDRQSRPGGAHIDGPPTFSPTHYHFGHQRTESGANVPPPELARMIPCRFFPNCRYGDQCYFAHPVMAMSAAALPDGAPLNSSMTPPSSHMQPVFYQPSSQGFPYPAPYSFYPPTGPSPFMHLSNYPQAEQFTSPANQHQLHQIYNSNNQHNNAAIGKNSQDHASPRQDTSSGGEKVTAIDEYNLSIAPEQDIPRNTSKTPPHQDTAMPASNEVAEEGILKPAHRRQSFNSFLQYHAIPFQPNGLLPGVSTGFMGDLRSMQRVHPHRIGPKSKRGYGGVNGYNKRIYGERPACTFFSNGHCRYGDECRFPHIMADGSDSRSLQAQQRSFQESNDITSLPRQVNNEELSASIPTGPAAARNEGKQKPSVNSKDAALSQNGEIESGQANVNGNGVVRSNPSKTSQKNEATASHSRSYHLSNGHGSSSSTGSRKHNAASQQLAQRIPTVNDFPALASASPNFGNQGEFGQTHRNGPIKGQPNGSSREGETSHNVSDGHVDQYNGNVATVKANFSAILSAPAPIRTRTASAERNHESNSDNPTPNAEDTSNTGETPSSGNEYSQKVQPSMTSNGSIGTGKEGKMKGSNLPVKDQKANSYKAVAATAPIRAINGQEGEDDDDFQLVNRSRGINKKNPGTQHHKHTKMSDGYAAQAKAVAA